MLTLNDFFKLHELNLRKGIMNQCSSDATSYFQISCPWNFIENASYLGKWAMKCLELRQFWTESKRAPILNKMPQDTEYTMKFLELDKRKWDIFSTLNSVVQCAFFINTECFCASGNLSNLCPFLDGHFRFKLYFFLCSYFTILPLSTTL